VLNREIEAKAAIAMSLFNLGTAHYNLQDFRKAIANFNESIGLIEQLRLTAMGAVRRDFLASQIDRYRWLVSAHIRAKEAASAFDTVELSSAKYLIEQMRERMKEKKTDFLSIADHRKDIAPKRAVLSFANVNWNGTITRFIVDREGISASEFSIDSFVTRINAKFERRISFTIKNLGGVLKGRRSRKDQQEAKSSPAFDAIINYYRHLLSEPDLKREEVEAREEIGRSLYYLLFSGLQESLATKTELLIIPGGILEGNSHQKPLRP